MSRGKLSIILVNVLLFCLSLTNATLTREIINSTENREAVCSDGSRAVYYIKNSDSKKWIIFLESGGGCFDYHSCLKRKILEPHLYGSRLYPKEITGEDILSSSKKENMFSNYNKVLIPYCSSDLWLGNKTLNLKGENGQILEVSFRGASIFRSVISDIDNRGLKNASEIWLAGSSAGGIGVINHARYILDTYHKTNVFALTDSAWFINYQNMLAKENMKKFLLSISAETLHGCYDTSLEYPCCLSIFCMASKQYFPRGVQLFNILSRYDIYGLSQGIMMPGKLTSYAKTSKIVSDMLAFGGEVSHSLRLTNSIRNMHSFIASCFQHTFFATSSLWSPGGLFNARSETSFRFPLFVFRHSVKKGRWNKVTIKGIAINKILQNWYDAIIVSKRHPTRNGSDVSTSVPSVLQDACRSVQCNPTCPKSIEFYSDQNSWPKWTHWLILVLYLVFTCLCISIKIFWTVQCARETRIQNEFVSSLYNGSNTLKAVGLPCCISSNYIGLSFTDVEYTVSTDRIKRQATEGRKWQLRFKKKLSIDTGKDKRQILKGVNAYFNPGQLIAIMGPSGSGKTTLLDILTGRRESKESKVFVNGMSNHETREWFKRHSGYVMQLATPYYEELTVRENLTFSALMRLPKTMSTKSKLMRVEQVIGQAGLNDYADVVVGSAIGPGLSGGQKRRLCVAIQLLRVPSVLFLDEPTSGLDSASSLELLETLHGLTLSGRLVILTIHQPRIEIFHMFDRILFLSNGHVAYFGSPIMAPTMIAEALKSSGEVLDASNPADTIMDVLIFKKSQDMIVEHYKDSGEIEAIKKAVSKATKNPVKTLSMKVKRYSSSLSDRLLAFDCRASTCQTKAQKLYLLVIFLLYGLALGSVYWQTDSGILLMSCYQVFFCASQLFMASVIHAHFIKAVPLFALEQAEGVGKSHELVLHAFIRIAALTVLPLLLCSAIIYLCTVVDLDLWKFFVTTMVHLQLNHVWIAIIMFSACAVPRYSTLVCPMLSAISGFAGGFLVPEPKMPAFYYWLFYINPTHWAYSATMKVLINDVMFECDSESRLECQSNMGIAVLKQFGFDEVNPYRNMIILMAMLILFVSGTVAVLEMRYTNKVKKWSRAIGRAIALCKMRFSGIGSHVFKDKTSKDWEKKLLVNDKDIEANGSCIAETSFPPSVKAVVSHNSMKNTGERNRNSHRDDDLLPLLLPVRVEPMLTARKHERRRPQTISVFSTPDYSKWKTKRSPVVRSSTFTYSERPLRFASEVQDDSLTASHLENSSQVPGITVEDTSICESNIVGYETRSRSDTCETEPDLLFSRYLDTLLKPHEVYCSVSGDRPKKSRKRSVTKRLPDDVKRNESVHIQRKASMLILAERRKSMTAQITGFGQAFAYLNEIELERKPVLKKNMALGVKRKVDAKRQQRGSGGSSRASVGSNDFLKVPDQFPVGEMSPLEIRRSRMLTQNAVDIPDENSNVIVDKHCTPERYGFDSSTHEKLTYPGMTEKPKISREEFRKDKGKREQSSSRKGLHGVASHNTNSNTPESVKVSALKISRKKFIPLKDHVDDHPRISDKFETESRSSVCRTPLGSIDETEEDDEFSFTENERNLARVRGPGLRRTSLQRAQQQHHFSENFSEITNWLYHSSQVLNEVDENSGSDTHRKNSTKAVGICELSEGIPAFQSGDDDDDEVDAEVCRAFAGNSEKRGIKTANADGSVISSEGPKSSDSGIRSGAAELMDDEVFAQKQEQNLNVQKTEFHNRVADKTNKGIVSSGKCCPAIVVSSGTPSPKIFSNALFVDNHKEDELSAKKVIDEPLLNGSMLGLDSKAMAWETRSNEEFSTDSYEQFNNIAAPADDFLVASPASGRKSTHMRRSSSCEFEFDAAEVKVDHDIARMRSLRRKCKQRKMGTKFEAKDNIKLSETIL